MTNFERITESPEKLAETLSQFAVYDFEHCSHCSKGKSKDEILEWLQHEEDFKKSLESDGSEYRI